MTLRRRIRLTLLLAATTLFGGLFAPTAARADTCIRLGELGIQVCLPIG